MLAILGWLVLVVISLYFSGGAFLMFMFEGFMGHSSGCLGWVFLILAITFFVMTYLFCPFSLVMG